MKLKATGLLLAAAMMLGIAALPAAGALNDVYAGVFTATADVGKLGSCTEDGTVGDQDIEGGGIGLLPVQNGELDVKNAWFAITGGAVIDVIHGAGTANLCGRLTAPLQGTDAPCLPPDPDDLTCIEPLDVKGLVGIGASCAATKGWGGYGKAEFTDPNVPGKAAELLISELGWKATLGGTFVVTGDTVSSDGDAGELVAVVQALNQNVVVSCIEKVQGNKDNPDPFTVAAVYAVSSVGEGEPDVTDKDPKKQP